MGKHGKLDANLTDERELPKAKPEERTDGKAVASQLSRDVALAWVLDQNRRNEKILEELKETVQLIGATRARAIKETAQRVWEERRGVMAATALPRLEACLVKLPSHYESQKDYADGLAEMLARNFAAATRGERRRLGEAIVSVLDEAPPLRAQAAMICEEVAQTMGGGAAQAEVIAKTIGALAYVQMDNRAHIIGAETSELAGLLQTRLETMEAELLGKDPAE